MSTWCKVLHTRYQIMSTVAIPPRGAVIICSCHETQVRWLKPNLRTHRAGWPGQHSPDTVRAALRGQQPPPHRAVSPAEWHCQRGMRDVLGQPRASAPTRTIPSSLQGSAQAGNSPTHAWVLPQPPTCDSENSKKWQNPLTGLDCIPV